MQRSCIVDVPLMKGLGFSVGQRMFNPTVGNEPKHGNRDVERLSEPGLPKGGGDPEQIEDRRQPTFPITTDGIL